MNKTINKKYSKLDIETRKKEFLKNENEKIKKDLSKKTPAEKVLKYYRKCMIKYIDANPDYRCTSTTTDFTIQRIASSALNANQYSLHILRTLRADINYLCRISNSKLISKKKLCKIIANGDKEYYKLLMA